MGLSLTSSSSTNEGSIGPDGSVGSMGTNGLEDSKETNLVPTGDSVALVAGSEDSANLMTLEAGSRTTFSSVTSATQELSCINPALRIEALAAL